MKKETDKASLRKIAKVAGVSLTATSFALHNQPGVSPATRERVLRVAKELHYVPDARIGNWMARVQGAKTKDLLPIAWLNTSNERDAWRRYRFHLPYIEGAEARARELGYKLEEIWYCEPGITMRRVANILYQRGIEGAIVCFPARRIRLEWNHIASVALGGSLLMPKLHRVMANINVNLQLALKSLRRLGYRRIGICFRREFEWSSHYSVRATVRDCYFSMPGTERISPLFHSPYWINYEDTKPRFGAWLRRHKPEVVVGHDSRLKEWVEAEGYRVPEDMGVVHLAVDDDVLDWAGVHSRRREMGATAVEWLVSQMRNHQFGVPKTPLTILIRGTWQTGRTLGTPKVAETKMAVSRKTRRSERAIASNVAASGNEVVKSLVGKTIVENHPNSP